MIATKLRDGWTRILIILYFILFNSKISQIPSAINAPFFHHHNITKTILHKVSSIDLVDLNVAKGVCTPASVTSIKPEKKCLLKLWSVIVDDCRQASGAFAAGAFLIEPIIAWLDETHFILTFTLMVPAAQYRRALHSLSFHACRIFNMSSVISFPVHL